MYETSATRWTMAAAFTTRQRRDVTDRIGTQTASATASLATASESTTGCIAAEARAVILRRPSPYRLHYVLHFVGSSVSLSLYKGLYVEQNLCSLCLFIAYSVNYRQTATARVGLI